MRQLTQSAVIILLLGAPLLAAPPTLDRLEPSGAQRGQVFRLEFDGSSLPPGAEVVTTLPAAFTPLTRTADRMAGTTLAFLVELRRDASPGRYPVRLQAPDGLSNLLLFTVGEYPDVAEAEAAGEPGEDANDQPADAQAVEYPAAIHGRLSGADRDVYRIEAVAGQRISIEVEARRAGSAIDPVLRITDASGKQLAMSNDAPTAGLDARLAFSCPRDGDYFVTVHDARYSEQKADFYHLKIGDFDFAEGLYPLGGRRGQTVDVEWYGGTLASPRQTKTSLLTVPESASVTAIAGPGLPGATRTPFAVSDLPERMESADRNLVPATVLNGRIEKPGETDEYSLAVKPGQQWRIGIQAAELRTTPLFPLLSIYDGDELIKRAGDEIPEKGTTTLEENTLTSRDPFVALTVPDGVDRLRIVVEDLVERGGPHYSYRLLAEPGPPDFLLTLSSPQANVPAGGVGYVGTTVHRRGYGGPVKLSVTGHGGNLQVAGGNVPGNEATKDRVGSTASGRLALSAAPGTAPQALNLTVWGEATLADGSVIRRKAVGPGLMTGVASRRGIRARELPARADWLGMELPTMVSAPLPARIDLASAHDVRLVKGTEHILRYKLTTNDPAIKRLSGFSVSAIGGRELRIAPNNPEADEIDGDYVKYLRTTFGGPEQTFDVILTAKAKVGDRTETLSSPIVTIHVVEGYDLTGPSDPVTLSKVGSIPGRIVRDEAFANPILVEATELPAGMSCQPVSVEPGETSFTVPCTVTSEAEAGEHEIHLTSSTTMVGLGKGKDVRYQIDPVSVAVVIQR